MRRKPLINNENRTTHQDHSGGEFRRECGHDHKREPANGCRGPAAPSLPVQSPAAAMAAHVTRLPEVGQENVDAIASAVKNGTYQVTLEQTADAILSELDARCAATA
jgi:anti-sigma28 factor (negative regulator of flagellin synthesis)